MDLDLLFNDYELESDYTSSSQDGNIRHLPVTGSTTPCNDDFEMLEEHCCEAVFSVDSDLLLTPPSLRHDFISNEDVLMLDNDFLNLEVANPSPTPVQGRRNGQSLSRTRFAFLFVSRIDLSTC